MVQRDLPGGPMRKSLLAAATAALTIAGFVGPLAAPASASSVSNVTVSLANNTAGATTAYTINFTTSASGALVAGTDTITLAAPAGTVWPPGSANYSVNGTQVSGTTPPTVN